jgi:hypothetical protein
MDANLCFQTCILLRANRQRLMCRQMSDSRKFNNKPGGGGLALKEAQFHSRRGMRKHALMQLAHDTKSQECHSQEIAIFFAKHPGEPGEVAPALSRLSRLNALRVQLLIGEPGTRVPPKSLTRFTAATPFNRVADKNYYVSFRKSESEKSCSV